jgi:CHAT domain-containing protein
VISTLWPGDDLFAALFAIHFYPILLGAAHPTVEIALKQTQTWLRSSTAQDLKTWSATISVDLKQAIDEHLGGN